MRKIPTLYQRDPDNMARVVNQVNPAAAWVLYGEAVATRKFDGTCVRVDQAGNWWTRREVKAGRRTPDGFLSVEHDENTGKTVGWEPIYQSSFVKAWDEAWTAQRESGEWIDTGTYELCGPKINGNPEGFDRHVLIRHGREVLDDVPTDFDGLRRYLADFPHEGIVWHHIDGRMAKIKVRDFPRGAS